MKKMIWAALAASMVLFFQDCSKPVAFAENGSVDLASKSSLVTSEIEVQSQEEIQKEEESKKDDERESISPEIGLFRDIAGKYQAVIVDSDMRCDLVVEDKVVVELKAVESVPPVFEAQLLTYMRLRNESLGLIISFSVPVLKNGIKRIIDDKRAGITTA